MDDQNKNLILATALSFAVILGWFLIFPPEDPPITPEGDAVETAAGELSAPPPVVDGDPAAPSGDTPAPAQEAARLTIDTPKVAGSISLVGGRIDALKLKDYREDLDENSENVTLLSPVGGAGAYYALYGWTPAGDLAQEAVPGADTLWQVDGSSTLTPESPVTLRWDNGAGLVFHRELSIDEDYMFTVRQTVENQTEAAVRLAPYGLIARHGEPDVTGFFILHEGIVRQNDDELEEIDYDDMTDFGADPLWGSNADVVDVERNGWTGFTDKYWMTTLIPDPGTPFQSVARYVPGADVYQLWSRLPTVSVSPGATASSSSMLFAGAKEWETIKQYEDGLGISNFLDSIDWGWFFFLTKPIFRALHFLHGLIGNMGWSILALTLMIKAILFPLAYKSYVSMAKMKELQPEMEKLKERAGDDRQKLQQGMMELYKKEKVNPASGCLPILLQIPIFFSLYKVIFVTIELRHAPFFGPFRDLSAPDPTSLFNLFGLLPFDAPEPGSILALVFIGVLPLLLGISMWLQQKLNPTPTDPTQQMIFAWMPWVFMFMLGGFASGLVLYWITNNTITFTQQYIIMRSHGHKPDVFGNIKKSFQRKKPAVETGKAKKK